MRDNGRDLCPGPTLGGKHGGEPLDGKLYVYGPPDHKDHGGDEGGQNGNGNPPLLAIVSEFAEDYSDTTTYLGYTQGPGGNTPRPTYAKNGNVSDICWRRDVQVTGSLAATLGFKTGYLAEEDPPY